MMQSLYSSDVWGSKSVVTKSPDLPEAKPVNACCLAIIIMLLFHPQRALIGAVNSMATLPIAAIPVINVTVAVGSSNQGWKLPLSWCNSCSGQSKMHKTCLIHLIVYDRRQGTLKIAEKLRSLFSLVGRSKKGHWQETVTKTKKLPWRTCLLI